ncbi:hypothetical protein [Serratia fonticola]|uniref:hypothetical protein n=1 Tax=Serratia fonticola TaxID=47917 RepID=UPI002DC0616E|nr:hypothetical protein [Serratia fonticola]MEB7886046.1 hypothetical protein [Serratia fonticola]
MEGELLCSAPRTVKYHIYQKSHRFIRRQQRVHRQNEIWRDISTKGQDSVVLQSERLYLNDVVVKYDIEEQQVE